MPNGTLITIREVWHRWLVTIKKLSSVIAFAQLLCLNIYYSYRREQFGPSWRLFRHSPLCFLSHHSIFKVQFFGKYTVRYIQLTTF